MFTTTKEIAEKFIKDGWGTDTSFSELTLKEAKEKGYLFAVDGIRKGRKFFKMNVCNNTYDDNGELLYYGNLKISAT